MSRKSQMSDELPYERMLQESLKGELKVLNAHLPSEQKALSDLLAEETPVVACSDGSAHLFKRKELDYLAGMLEPDEQKALVLPILAGGGKGTSNVSGSVVPREMAELSKPWEDYGDVLRSRERYFELLPLMRMLYAETNPVPLKAALEMIGADVGRPRRPLTELSEPNRRTLRLTLERLGILREDSYQREFFSRR